MWQSEYVEVDGVKFHYTRTGGDKPTMVLLHGITDLGLCWSAVAEVLEADYDVIMIDARGHGSSDAPNTGYDWSTFTDDAYGVIQALELDKPILMGHSMGAMTALILASRYPDVPQAILLEDPPPLWMPMELLENEIATRQVRFAESIANRKSMSRAELLETHKEENGHWSEKEREPWADSKFAVSPKVAGMFSEDAHKGLDLANTLSNVTCQTLLITANVDRGAIVADTAIEGLKSYIPQVQVEQITDAGHSIHRDQFDKFMGAIQTYLKQH